MIKRITFIVMLIGLIAFDAYGQTPTASTTDAASKKTFRDLLGKLKNGDTSIDFKALRIAGAAAGEAGEPDGVLLGKALTSQNEKKFDETIKIGDQLLEASYPDVDAHMLMAVVYRDLGNTRKFEFHKAVYLGLLNSILNSGDGKTPQTAYVVISVAEEYAVLRARKLKRGSQAVRDDGGHKYDVLTVTDPVTNKTQDVWFNIDIVWRAYERKQK